MNVLVIDGVKTVVIDITQVPLSGKKTIAEYIQDDTLEKVNTIIEPCHPRNTLYTNFIKRGLDIIIAILGLIVTFPVNMVICIITFLDVGRPLLFKQTRIGKNKKPFTIYKFRNMKDVRDRDGELLPPSERVTSWGRFVRKTSLDELLNLVSVLKGDMSIIGPRPLLDYYVQRLNTRHAGIFEVRPGLECPMHKKVNHAITWQDRLDNYVWYVENCSFLVDLMMTVRLFAAVFDRKSNKIRGDAEQQGIMGYDQEGNLITTKAVPDKYVYKYLHERNVSDINDIIEKRKVI